MQVQCQRTRMFIPGQTAGPQTLSCPYCDDHETYQQLGVIHLAWWYVAGATEICRSEFTIPDDGLKTAVWLGDSPETVFEQHLNRHNIYLARDSNHKQNMYSGAHEAFHRVCGEQKNAIHWIDEMFAILFSLLYLNEIGESKHADDNINGQDGLIKQSQQCSMSEMLQLQEDRYLIVYHMDSTDELMSSAKNLSKILDGIISSRLPLHAMRTALLT
ncbi:MAG TPA: hypothetical protein VGG98_05925 [Solirubrobacteraceae bacterium]